MRVTRKSVLVVLVVVAVAGLGAGVWARRANAAKASVDSSGATVTAAPGNTKYSMQVGSQTRTYVLHVPAGLDRTQPVPLLIELHGGGGTGQGMERLTRFDSMADREGFVVVAPDGLDRGWNDGREEKASSTGGADDVGFISALIDRIEGQVHIDARRIYVAGMSNGAMMTGRLACELSGRIAAVAQVAGTASVGVSARCAPSRPVPMLEIHGTSDPLVPYGGGTVAVQLGGRGQVVGVDAWAQSWVGFNLVTTDPVTTAIGPDTTVRTWHGSTPQSDLVFYRIAGAGHTWPGGSQYLPKIVIGSTTKSFDASELVWEFVSSHRAG